MDMEKVVKKDPQGNLLPMNFIENWFRAQNNQKKVLSKDHKIVCSNPQCGVTEHREFKQFYILPKCFIISLNRGKNYSNTSQLQIPMILNLENKIEMGNSPKEFNLVGMVKRVVNEKKEEYFVAIYLDRQQNIWKLSDRNGISVIPDPFAHQQGLVLILFYSAVPKMGQ